MNLPELCWSQPTRLRVGEKRKEEQKPGRNRGYISLDKGGLIEMRANTN
jgi:hypothetical protein